MNVQSDDLAAFETPRYLVDPALRSLRGANTFLDRLFYDVGVLARELRRRGEGITTNDGPTYGRLDRADVDRLDLGALYNPEGCILVIDPSASPSIRRFDRVDEFVAWATIEANTVTAVTISGAGSSALGSAALAWNVSAALGQRVAAIVPGYGLADFVGQAMGAWFGFEAHNWLASLTQKQLATTFPGTARIGHSLLATIPDHPARRTGVPVFVTGSAASDVLHALLHQMPAISVLIGHSKGALAIGNALRSLSPDVTRRMMVATFGCPIGESVPVGRYVQFLGKFDLLGQLNSWGNKPDQWIATDHSTNSMIPLSIIVANLTRAMVEAEGPPT
jgi:hypothetical protein